MQYPTTDKCPVCEKQTAIAGEDPWIEENINCHSCGHGGWIQRFIKNNPHNQNFITALEIQWDLTDNDLKTGE